MTVTSWMDALKQPFQTFVANIQSILPNIAGAVAVVALGLVVAFLLKRWVAGLLRLSDRLLKRRGVGGGEGGRVGTRGSGLFGRILFWIVFLFFLAAAIEMLGQPVISDWSNTIAQYLPNVLVAALIIFIGAVFGNIAKATVDKFTTTAHISHGDFLSRLVQVLIVTTASLIAVDQLGIEIHLLIIILSIVTGVSAGGIALAFAFGARSAVANIIAIHYVTQLYQVGQTVRVGTVEGRIMDISGTAVILETKEGRCAIPGQRFSEEVSVLLRQGS